MKSIKPGRGPSGMSFIGSVIAIVFGIFWTVIASIMTTNLPFGIIGKIFPLFGVIFIIMGIVQAAYHYNNATSRDRFSLFDITDRDEEGDPGDKWIRNGLLSKGTDKYVSEDVVEDPGNDTGKKEDMAYCPYCGKSLNSNYTFCPRCGRNVRNS